MLRVCSISNFEYACSAFSEGRILDEQTVAAKRTTLVKVMADTALIFFAYYLVALVVRLFGQDRSAMKHGYFLLR
jgi:hypothetical protein